MSDLKRRKLVLRVEPRKGGCTIVIAAPKRLVTFPLRGRQQIMKFVGRIIVAARLKEAKAAREAAKRRRREMDSLEHLRAQTAAPEQLGLGLDGDAF